jgi:hypothetical protein
MILDRQISAFLGTTHVSEPQFMLTYMFAGQVGQGQGEVSATAKRNIRAFCQGERSFDLGQVGALFTFKTHVSCLNRALAGE